MKYINNKLYIENNEIIFEHNIESILQIQDILIVLLDISPVEDEISNNVYGVKEGVVIWQVEDVRNYLKNSSFAFSYTMMRQIDSQKVMLTEYNGYKIAIDPFTGHIIPNKEPIPIDED